MTRSRRRRWLRWLLWIAGAVLLLAVALLVLWVTTWPDVAPLAKRFPETTAFIERDRAKGVKVRWRPVAYDEIADELKLAVLVAEDINFFSHSGFDKTEISNAARDAIEGKRVRGASTITQQLAKNLWLSPERSWLRKGREAACALALEALLPKERILEHYLSAIELGERVFGVEAAARTNFGVPASRLDAAQAAWLAAMIPSPSYYLRHPSRHQARAALIARRVAGHDAPEQPTDEDEEAGSPR